MSSFYHCYCDMICFRTKTGGKTLTDKIVTFNGMIGKSEQAVRSFFFTNPNTEASLIWNFHA